MTRYPVNVATTGEALVVGPKVDRHLAGAHTRQCRRASTEGDRPVRAPPTTARRERFPLRIVMPVVVFAIVAASCQAAPGAIQNGRLPASMLTTISPTCQVANPVAGSLVLMLIAANTDGVALAPQQSSFLPPSLPQPPRIEACYRDYDMQVWWRNLYCYLGECQLAAVPGTSVHGWGRAVDFQDQDGAMQFGSPGYNWLTLHAAQYGFYHPAWAEPNGSAPEPWHWQAD